MSGGEHRRQRPPRRLPIPATIFTAPQIATIGTLDGDGSSRASIDVRAVARLHAYEKHQRAG